MAARIIDYDLVTATDLGQRFQEGFQSGLADLAHQVREKIQEGWQPFGPPQQYQYDPHLAGYMYVQAIIKYADG